MKMFILGAVCFYVVTSLIGFVLNELEIIDNWTFGEFYTELIPSIVIIPFTYIYNIYKHRDYYKLMFKYGMFFKKYENLRTLTTEQLRTIQKTSCGFAVRIFIDEIMKERGEKSYSEYTKRE